MSSFHTSLPDRIPSIHVNNPICTSPHLHLMRSHFLIHSLFPPVLIPYTFVNMCVSLTLPFLFFWGPDDSLKGYEHGCVCHELQERNRLAKKGSFIRWYKLYPIFVEVYFAGLHSTKIDFWFQEMNRVMLLLLEMRNKWKCWKERNICMKVKGRQNDFEMKETWSTR